MRLGLAMAAAVALAACGTGVVAVDDPAGDGADALASTAVKVTAQGNWSEVLACSGQCVSRYHFWADLSVRNDAFQKDVGARWSMDGWSTAKSASASYVADLGGGYEKWHVEVDLGQGMSPPQEVEFAVYATMNGTTYWDANNNYYVYQSVSAEQPVRLLHAGLAYSSRTGVTLSGAVRVYDLAYQKVVSVRYSTDGWATSHEASAAWSSAQDWSFSLKGIAKAKPLPSDVEFAVRYQVNGQEFWDNNRGQNYRLQLEPTFTADSSWVPSLQDLSGIATLGGSWQTNLPVSAVQARVDNASWKTGPNFTFSTEGLADGAHTAQFKVKIQGGYTATASIPFTVRNGITPLDAWQPPYPNASPGSIAPWALAAGSDGKIYVNWSDGRIARYDAWGQTAAPLLYDAAPAGIQGIALDAKGRVYGFATYPAFAVYRYGADGKLDPTFTLDLSQPIAGLPLCYVSAIAALGDGVQVADSCNERVLAFDSAGEAESATHIPGSAITSLGVADGALWAANQEGLTRLDPASSGVQLGATLAVGGLNGPAGVASAGGYTWVVDNLSRLQALDANGAVVASWLGGTGSLHLHGETPLARGVAALSDGSLAVVATDDGALVRFSSALK